MATSTMTPGSVKGKRGRAVESDTEELLGFMMVLGEGLLGRAGSRLTVGDQFLLGQKVPDSRTDNLGQRALDALLYSAR